MSRPFSVLMNAAGVPVLTVNGVTASIIFLLQPEQVWRRLNDNARKTNWRRGNLVILERLQFPACWLLIGQYLVDCGVDFFEASRADELLQHRDVWMVRCIQSKAFREGLQQAGIIRLRTLDHR